MSSFHKVHKIKEKIGATLSFKISTHWRAKLKVVERI
jgi:hypothetical protein